MINHYYMIGKFTERIITVSGMLTLHTRHFVVKLRQKKKVLVNVVFLYITWENR